MTTRAPEFQNDAEYCTRHHLTAESLDSACCGLHYPRLARCGPSWASTWPPSIKKVTVMIMVIIIIIIKKHSHYLKKDKNDDIKNNQI